MEEKRCSAKTLTNRIKIKIRFSEVDSIKMAWHGSYVKYLEDGREEFGREFGLEYMHMFNSGYVAPIVDMHLQYKQTVTIDDTIIVETTYVPNRAAKLVFDYKIYRESDMALVLTARTIQLFMSHDGTFEVSNPEFFAKWKEQWGY